MATSADGAATYLPHVTEPATTALMLAILGVLMGASVLLSRVAGRISVPVPLLFLAVGMAAGSEGIGRVAFADYGLAFRIGTVALVLILFDGGLNTSLGAVKRAVGPAVMLATVGVGATAALVAVAARLCGLPWPSAFLLGAVVSSTDAAAVFAVLRGSGIELTKRVATTLELESGLNDPLAVLLTLMLAGALGHPGAGRLVVGGVLQLVLGLGGGVVVGLLGRFLVTHGRPAAAGLWPVLTVALAFGAFGVTTLVGGSGFLATYTAAVVMGNGRVPDRSGLRRVHDALAWLAQVVMFVVLGLLSTPSHLVTVGAVGLAIALGLAFVARPAAVLLCLLPFRFHAREVAFVGWVGLRGAVPIVLAAYPVLAGAPHAEYIFDVVFFIVVVNAVVPGATVRRAAARFGVEHHGPPPPSAVLEIASTRPLADEVMSFCIDHACAVAGAAPADVPLPPEAAVVLVVRGDRLIAPGDAGTLAPGDHVFVVCRPDDRREVALLFGREER